MQAAAQRQVHCGFLERSGRAARVMLRWTGAFKKGLPGTFECLDRRVKRFLGIFKSSQSVRFLHPSHGRMNFQPSGWKT
jgi:hypothetical protein